MRDCAFWRTAALLLVAWLALTPASQAMTREQAVFGGGCFWAMQQEFELLRGVDSAVPGYAGGHKPDPTYEQVCAGTTGHAEVIRVNYDPAVISYQDLLRAFFAAHDPTTWNRQGNDEGEQYRSLILTRNAVQAEAARKMIRQLTHARTFARPIVTEIKPLARFYPAEEEHRHYCARHPFEPYCRFVVAREVEHFRQAVKDLLAS